MTTPNRLPIVRLFVRSGEDGDEDPHGSGLYYADRRLQEYRSVDGSHPWIVKAGDIACDMDTVIQDYEVRKDFS